MSELNWQTYHYLVSNPNKIQYPYVDPSFSTQTASSWEFLFAPDKEAASTRNKKGPKVSSSKKKSSLEYVRKHWEDGELNLEKGVYLIRDPGPGISLLLLCNPWQVPEQGQAELSPFVMWEKKCEEGREGGLCHHSVEGFHPRCPSNARRCAGRIKMESDQPQLAVALAPCSPGVLVSEAFTDRQLSDGQAGVTRWEQTLALKKNIQEMMCDEIRRGSRGS